MINPLIQDWIGQRIHSYPSWVFTIFIYSHWLIGSFCLLLFNDQKEQRSIRSKRGKRKAHWDRAWMLTLLCCSRPPTKAVLLIHEPEGAVAIPFNYGPSAMKGFETSSGHLLEGQKNSEFTAKEEKRKAWDNFILYCVKSKKRIVLT